ncbi:MAG: hypothetical protein ACTSPB_06550 [Candidatus Thorarchaeota archaeon]
MASFPKAVWDGLSTSRKNLDDVKSPDYKDWLAMLDELQAMQSYILNLTGSLESMPNLAEDLSKAQIKVDKFVEELGRLSPPADLYKEVTKLRRQLEEIDTRQEHERLKNGVRKLFLRTRHLEKAYKELKKDMLYQIEVLMNSVRNQFQQLQRKVKEQHKVLQSQISELQDVLQNPELD